MSDRPTPETDKIIPDWMQGVTKELPNFVEIARKMERERDEAREERDHWKTEYEIVVARLCGKKHPRDNGIVAPDEIIPMLTRERDEAREMQAKALRERESTEREVEAMLERAIKAERERDEAREKAERYRLEANALMLKVMEGAK